MLKVQQKTVARAIASPVNGINVLILKYVEDDN
jgi:hypothetical protein